MSEEIIIGNLLTRIMRYSNKYEISVQFWPDQWAIFINKDGVELTSFGGEPENTLQRGVDYLDRINKKFKVSLAEPSDEKPNSGQLQQHNVMESVLPPANEVVVYWPCLNCSKDTCEAHWLGNCSRECMKQWLDNHKKNSSGKTAP